MKFSVVIALFLGLVAVAQALPSRTARQDAAAAPADAAVAAEPAAAAAETAVAETDKHAHAHPVAKPEVHPHPLNWHAIYNAFKAVAPVVGGLIEPLLINIAHGVVGAVIETINSGFSIPVPHPHHVPEHHEHHEHHE